MQRRFFLTFVLAFASLACMAHSVTQSDGMYHVSHSWTYKGRQWSSDIDVSKDLYSHYKKDCEHVSDNYMRYILSEYDRSCIRGIVGMMRDLGKEAKYTESDNVRNVIAFVQSFNYVSDLVTTGKDNYVRYPVEMLVDGGGDCEDYVALLAAILYEMNYGEVLVSLPNHLALAIKGDASMDGVFYDYEGSRYYYLETTGQKWQIGQIPSQFRDEAATLIPIDNHPKVYMKSYKLLSIGCEQQNVTFKIDCVIENTGPGTTDGTYLYAAARSSGRNAAGSLFSEKMVDCAPIPEGQSEKITLYLTVPRHNTVSFAMTIGGDNFKSDTLYSKSLDVK